MHVLTIIGNRPQFVKLAAVSPLLREHHRETLVHTGQHHDRELSEIFFDELGLPTPDIDLGIAGGSNATQTSRMLAALEPLIEQYQPDVILVYGDTNSTLAGALVAAQTGVPLVHVEAGLRSFDRAMPEEVNRVVCDALAALLLVPSANAAENLEREGVIGEIAVTGDVMGDVVLGIKASIDDARVRSEQGIPDGDFILLTAHRAANVDDADRLERLVTLIEALPLPVVFPIHPRTHARLDEFGLHDRLASVPEILLLPSLGYLSTVGLAAGARAVLTDSGGLQKEAVWLGTQCLTLRPSTEWVETVETGWNTLVDLDVDRTLGALRVGPPQGSAPELYRAGMAGADAVRAIERWAAKSAIARVGSAS